MGYMLTKEEPIGERWARLWFRNILNGLRHMNSEGFSHLDIKADNILLDSLLTAKIGDLGCARPNVEGIDSLHGTYQYMSPEIRRRQFPYDGEKADVFSLAIVLFGMVMRNFPFNRNITTC